MVLAIFFAFRGINNMMYLFILPKDCIWTNLDGYFLLANVDKGHDFLFSGHIAFLNICALEWYELGHKSLARIIWVVLAYTSIIFLAFQVHYTADIFTALYASHYFYITVDENLNTFEASSSKVFVQIKQKLLGNDYWQPTEELI